MQTGLILLPGALTTAIMMPIVGKMLQRGFPAADHERGRIRRLLRLHADAFEIDAAIPDSSTSSGRSIWRGVGLGLLFVPLTTLALGNLRGADIAQGAGMTNMMRQLGGSFGVALIATYIQQRSWTHRQNLLRHVSIYDPALRERLDAITRGFVGRGSPLATAQRQAYGAIEGAVVRQTFLLTYMDAFRLVGIFFLICIPMLVLFKRVRRGGPVAPMH